MPVREQHALHAIFGMSLVLNHRTMCVLQEAIPYFRSGLKGVARSMPTSAAVDRFVNPASVPPCHAEVLFTSSCGADSAHLLPAPFSVGAVE